MTKEELLFIRDLLEALLRKCKTEALHLNTRAGLEIIRRELELKDGQS